MKPDEQRHDWDDVVDFWFPEGSFLGIEPQAHQAHWHWRMQGGADAAIIARYSALTEQAASGALDHWADNPHGRLALIILLDQFSRSVWRETPGAFAQDQRALELANQGFANGHYEMLATPWFQVVHGLPLGHCEGPGHLQRLDQLIALRQAIAAAAPAPLQPIYTGLVRQAGDVRKVIAAFGRHPHRNAVLGRATTSAEEAYIAGGDFPHVRAFRQTSGG